MSYQIRTLEVVSKPERVGQNDYSLVIPRSRMRSEIYSRFVCLFVCLSVYKTIYLLDDCRAITTKGFKGYEFPTS